MPSSVVRITGPSSVMATVFSKCADGRPSRVHTSHPSGIWRVLYVPRLIIGSMASTMPASSFTPVCLRPKFGTLGSSCMSRPMPCPTYSRTTP